MSEYCVGGEGTENMHESISEDLNVAAIQTAQPVPMPFDLDSREADALRGALGFLFSLIASYDEFVALNALADESAGPGHGDPH